MTTQYKSVKDLVTNVNKNDSFSKKVHSEIDNHSISKFLSIIRCKHNLTQKELAKKIKCTQSRISKIESSPDNAVSIKDLTDYGKALNHKLVIGFEKNDMTIVERIKHHVFMINGLLNKLISFAKDDKDIDKSISSFFGEALYNILNMFETSSKSLKSIKITKSVKKSVVIEEPKEFDNKTMSMKDKIETK